MAKYYDFFLSYAWIDNEEPSCGLRKGWVDRFYAALQRELRELWVSQVAAYRDEHKIKSGEIEASIRAAIQQSIGFVCLLSKGYFNSDWCPMEAEVMRDAIVADPLLSKDEAKKRIIPVLLSPFAADDLGEFKGIFAYPAYRWKDEAQTDWELLEPNAHKKGRGMVRKVAIALKELLESIFGCNGPLYGHKGKIYLSASPDVTTIRVGIQTTFRDYGYPVVPGAQALPMNQPAFDSVVKEFLSKSRASVHALGAEASDDAGFIMHHREYELAKSACEIRALERCIVWIPENWISTSPVQQGFVERLRKGDPITENVWVSSGTFQHLKERIRAECRRFEEPPLSTPPLDTQRRIYLVYHEHDKDHQQIHALEDWMKARDITVLKPLFDGHPSEKRAQRDAARRTAYAALVYCGVKSAEWANQQFRTLRTAMFAPERLLFYLSGQHGEFSPPAEMAMSITPDPKGGLCLVFARLEQLFLL